MVSFESALNGCEMLTVLVLVKSPILGEAIEKNLTIDPGLIVHNEIWGNIDRLRSAISLLRPNVVVIEGDLLDINLREIKGFLNDLIQSRIIVISPEHNQLEINEYYQVAVSGLADLFALVKGGNSCFSIKT